MHEAALARRVLEIIESAARQVGASRVRAATVEVGEIAAVEPAALRLAFEVLRQGTRAADCTLLVQRVPLQVSCPACGREGPAHPTEPRCDACGGAPVKVLRGRELSVVSIEVSDGPELPDP